MAAVRTFYKGSKPRLRVTFTNPDTGALIDPNTISLKIKDPSGNVTTLSETQLVKESVGKYYHRLSLSAAGTWAWTYTGSTTDDSDVAKGEINCVDPGV